MAAQTPGTDLILDVENIEVIYSKAVQALRGLSLMSLMQMEVNTLAMLLPRITTPALLPEDVAALDPVDLLSMGGEVMGFFMPAEAVEALGLPGR